MATDPHSAGVFDDIDVDLGERYYRGQRDTEERWTDEIIDLIRRHIDRRFEQGQRPARRDAHAFDSGCVKAAFRVDSDLNPELHHGIFAPGREYEAWIRFSNGNVEQRSRWWPDARGMAIKLVGVEGRKLIDDETQSQDFILISHPVFFVDDLERYHATLDPFLKGGVIDQYVRSPLQLRGRETLLAVLVNLRWIGNPLFQQYWSMTPYRLGVDPAQKMAVKYSAKPRLASKRSLTGRLAAYLDSGFSLRKRMNDTLAATKAAFDFYIQRYVDERTPIEDSKIEWVESISKLEHVATITIPRQDLISSERDWFCENLSFNPWHCLPEHKPLGLVNRVRRKVYVEISNHRHKLNQVPRQEPTSTAGADAS